MISPLRVSQKGVLDVVGAAACRIRLRLPSSTATICVVKTATVGELVSYIQHVRPELEHCQLDLLCGNPPVSIINEVGLEWRVEWQSDKTLDEMKLNGSALIVRTKVESDEFTVCSRKSSFFFMIGTSIYRRDFIKRAIIGTIGFVLLYCVCFRPVKAVTGMDS